METKKEWEQFIRNRITDLRLKQGISEYQLSFELGNSRGYINNISSGKTSPSMKEFLKICEYFNITPRDFFDYDVSNPELIVKITDELRTLDDDDIILILSLVKRLKKNN